MSAETNGDARKDALKSGVYYTTGEVAEKLRFTDRRIRQFCERGKFKAFKVGRGWLIPRTEVDQLSVKDLEAPKRPVNVTVVEQVRGPLQEKAYGMHERKDHSYLEDDRYEGHVFTTETIDGPNFWEGWEVPPGIRYSVKPDCMEAKALRVPIQRQIRQCLWCGVYMWTEPGAPPETPLELMESIHDRRTIKWTKSEGQA